MRQVRTLQAEFSAGRVAITVEVLQFLRKWLEGHIKGWDQKFSSYYRQRAAA